MGEFSHLDDSKAQIELKHKEVYDSPEWKSLNELDRAQLLLVAEGVKSGTIIQGDNKYFLNVVEGLGLHAVKTSDPYNVHPIFEVSSPAVMSQYYRENLVAPEKEKMSYFHEINGKFLGYPECCTKEYNNPQKNLKARKAFSPKKFISNLNFELIQLFNSGKPYPGQLDFRPPSFTPCSAYCGNALKVLGIWESVLQAGDPEAAKVLQHFNRSNSPTFNWHKEEVRSEMRKKEVTSVVGRVKKAFTDFWNKT